MTTDVLPLFPLESVLFPGGELTLRVFEARYLDLVRECGRQGSGFGICLITEGCEVGAPATPAAVGCEARIHDFASAPDGVLVLTVHGERRFRIEQARPRDNGLLVADVRWFAPGSPSLIRPEHQLLALLLRRIVERAGPPHDRVEKERFDDADWVSWRLAEWLPLPWAERQALLQEGDAQARLQRLLELIPQVQNA